MIALEFKLTEDPVGLDYKYVYDVRILDTDDINYDKAITAGGNDKKRLLQDMADKVTVILSVDDHKDVDKVNEALRQV